MKKDSVGDSSKTSKEPKRVPSVQSTSKVAKEKPVASTPNRSKVKTSPITKKATSKRQTSTTIVKPRGATSPQVTAPKTAAHHFDFDVCVSFAGEDRVYTEAVVRSLKRRGIRCFYDLDEQADLWGKDLFVHLDEVYRKKARYCVMFVSESYKIKLWTNHERQSIQARAFTSQDDYILPVRLDNAEIPGLRPTLGYIDGQRNSPSQVAALIQSKVKGSSSRTHSTAPKAAAKSRVAKRVAPVKPPTSATTRVVTSSGKWILLGKNFFLAERVVREKEGVEVQIAPRNAREEAELRALEGRPHYQSALTVAWGNDALECHIQGVTSRSEEGKTIYVLNLRKERDSRSGFEMMVQNLTADEIAQRRARFILLGEKPMTDDDYLNRHIEGGFGEQSYEANIIAQTLNNLGGSATTDNLQKARLAAISHLIRTGIVEHVLELRLGPITKVGLPIMFEGRRSTYYTNVPATTIEISAKVALQK